MNEKLKKGLTAFLAILLGMITGLAGALVLKYLYDRKMEKMGFCPYCGRRLENGYQS